MYSASDLRKGLKIEIDGAPYVITDFNFVKPGKGAAIYTCKLKNLATGATMTRAYRNNDKVDQPQLTEKRLHYSYCNGADYVFLDENFEEIVIAGDVMGDSKRFMVENISVDVLFHNGRPIEVTLPNFVEKAIVYTEPGVRGDTATNVLKPAKVEGGYELQVPLFINQGDTIKIDTRTGEYVDRVSVRK
ncbi:MAG: elongation factor P [Verrucomicrobiota bacterium]|nr:elongation factor P [Verrucomicrobiota bacterium]